MGDKNWRFEEAGRLVSAFPVEDGFQVGQGMNEANQQFVFLSLKVTEVDISEDGGQTVSVRAVCFSFTRRQAEDLRGMLDYVLR